MTLFFAILLICEDDIKNNYKVGFILRSVEIDLNNIDEETLNKYVEKEN